MNSTPIIFHGIIDFVIMSQCIQSMFIAQKVANINWLQQNGILTVMLKSM